MTTSLTRTVGGFRFAETFIGDTMQRIAYRELGDAARWVELVAFNGLVPPFISDTAAGPDVVLAGDLIRIPAAERQASASIEPELVFEVDAALGTDGDLVVNGGDFETVSGLANLRQALRNRLDTDAGDLPFHPQYGSKIRQLIGAANGPTAAALAAAYARSCVERDSRIRRVTTSTAVVAGDTITVALTAEPIVGRVVDLTQVL